MQARPRCAPARCARPRAPVAAAAATTAGATPLTTPVATYRELVVPAARAGPPAQEIVVADITARVAAIVADTGVREGVVTLLSKHTTVGLTINEWESRLARDVEAWLLSLAPPDDRSTAGTPGRGVRYAHNDIDQRPGDGDERERCLQNGWAVDAVDGPRGLAAWRAQEPVNAHSHLLAMLLGASEAVPVSGGRMTIGQWQSLLMVDTDGPRERTVGVQVMGYK